MGYKAGSLTIELFGIDNNATMSIQNTIKSLSALSRAIDKINKTDFLTAGKNLESSLKILAFFCENYYNRKEV